MRAKKPIKFKDAKGELNEVLHDEQNLKIEAEPISKQEELIEKEQHVDEDHYHGIHHFDKFGHHDDISKIEFSIRSQFPKSKKALTFKISMAALILGLSIAVSAIDMVLEKFSPNIGGVGFEMRILDLLVIIIGIPVVGLFGSIGIAFVEPWFHFLIDSDHVWTQILLDSFGYAITVCVFFFIFYILFRNSPIHKDPNKRKEWFKEIIPGLVIVPIEAVLFTCIFVLALYANYKVGGTDLIDGESPKDIWQSFTSGATGVIVIANFGIQIARFIIMYVFFVIVERAMKPINHRYR